MSDAAPVNSSLDEGAECHPPDTGQLRSIRDSIGALIDTYNTENRIPQAPARIRKYLKERLLLALGPRKEYSASATRWRKEKC